MNAKFKFTIEPAGRGFVTVRVPPANTFLIDGKTGKPCTFRRADVHSINYSGVNSELYRVLKSLYLMEREHAP